MPIDLTNLSDDNGNVDPVIVKEWLKNGDNDTECPETAQKICKAIGYDPAKPMKFNIFVKRYVCVKMFFDGDRDNSGFLDKTELKKQLQTNQEKGFDEVYQFFDLNSDGKISIGNKATKLCYENILLSI